MKRVRVKLYPLTDRIKRKFLDGNSLRAPAVFVDGPSPSEIGSWTFIVNFEKSSENEAYFWGIAGYGMDEAPHHLLIPGTILDFLDGSLPVIRVEVLEEVID